MMFPLPWFALYNGKKAKELPAKGLLTQRLHSILVIQHLHPVLVIQPRLALPLLELDAELMSWSMLQIWRQARVRFVLFGILTLRLD